MANVISMPQLGSTMEEATALKWLKSEGDSVEKGEALLKIETDKATIDVECSATGIVLKLLISEGDSVPIRTPIAVVGEANERWEPSVACGEPDFDPSISPLTLESPTSSSSRSTVAMALQNLKISPRARRLADEKGVCLNLLADLGTGPEGRVIEQDVLNWLEKSLSPDATFALKPPRLTPLASRIAEDLGVDPNDLSMGLPGSRIRSEDILSLPNAHRKLADTPKMDLPATPSVILLRGIRKRIAESVSKSAQTIPSVTLYMEVDMTECVELREKINADFEKKHGVRLSYNDLIVYAVARCLELHPLLNSSLIGEEIRLHAAKNIGIAVALQEGLLLPVLKNAHAKSLATLAKERMALTERALSGTFTPEDLAGGTFTISNLGSFGVDLFDPIIPPGQCAILGVGRIADKPAVVAKQIVVRFLMNLCLTFDHRILDGAPAAQFLLAVKNLLENPVRMLV